MIKKSLFFFFKLRKFNTSHFLFSCIIIFEILPYFYTKHLWIIRKDKNTNTYISVFFHLSLWCDFPHFEIGNYWLYYLSVSSSSNAWQKSFKLFPPSFVLSVTVTASLYNHLKSSFDAILSVVVPRSTGIFFICYVAISSSDNNSWFYSVALSRWTLIEFIFRDLQIFWALSW